MLADPVRREILELLAGGERSAGDIAGRFPVTGPAVSRHLRVLRESGLATCRHEGQRRIYALNPPALAEVGHWADQLLQEWRSRFDALGRHLDEAKGKRA